MKLEYKLSLQMELNHIDDDIRNIEEVIAIATLLGHDTTLEELKKELEVLKLTRNEVLYEIEGLA